ncbi:MAG: potassium channel family protein [Candidatus Nezhaarchaeales archaeon]
MRVIIAGGGDVGEVTAKILKNHGYKVVVIDSSPEVCEKIARTLEVAVVVGDAVSPLTLEEAGIERADVFIAVTGKDNVNLISGLLAANYGVKRVMVRIKDPAYMEACKSVGLCDVIQHVDIAAMWLEAMVFRNNIVEIANLIAGDLEIEEVTITEKSKYQGMKIANLIEKHNVYPLLLEVNGKAELPRMDRELKIGDKIFLLRKARKSFHLPEF